MITVKGGACGAVTRDSLRSPLTLITPGTIRRLSAAYEANVKCWFWAGEDVRDWPAAAVVGLLLGGIAW